MTRTANNGNRNLSTGPQSPEGKAKSRLNAITHGLTSAKLVVLQTESADDYARLVSGFVDTFRPATEPEICLVEEMANAQWKRRRAERMETALLDLSLIEIEGKLDSVFDGEIDSDMKMALAYRDAHHGNGCMANLERHIVRLSRQFQRAHDKLTELQDIRRQEEAEKAAQEQAEHTAPATEKAQNRGENVKFQNEPVSDTPRHGETYEMPEMSPSEAA